MQGPGASRKRALVAWVLAILLLSAASLSHTELHRGVAYGFTLLVYIAAVAVYVHFYELELVARKFYLVVFSLLVLATALSMLLSPSVASIIRLGVLLTFTAANLFVLPRVIPFRYLLAATARFAALLVLLGLLPYFGVTSAVFGDLLSLWHGSLYWLPSRHPTMSVFVNPNALGFLAYVGTMSAIGERWAYDNRWAGFLAVVNGVGVALTNYRTGFVALLVGVGVLVVYYRVGSATLATITASGIVLFGATLLMVIGVLPGPDTLTDVSLNNRRILWEAGVQAFLERPLSGYGLGNDKAAIQPYLEGTSVADVSVHNSYLRMFIASGIVGGAIYLLFVLGMAVGAARDSVTPSAAVLSAFLTSFVIVQVFNDLTFIGISLPSTVIGLGMGYYFSGTIGLVDEPVVT